MKPHYHNTVNAKEPILSKREAQAKTQADRILEHFKKVKVPMAPSEVWADIFYGVPLTSIRRAMSNLTRDGKLEKTERQVKGLYGHPEYLWQLPGGQQHLF